MAMKENVLYESIHFSKIKEGERYRKDYGKVNELVESIHSDGLFHPIGVRKKGDEYELVFGGRRFKALLQLIEAKKHEELIPCKIYLDELTELQLREMELSENLYRKDLTWYERQVLRKRIFELREAISGRKPARVKDGEGITIEEIAASFGISKASLSNDIAMQKQIEALPPDMREHVMGAPTRSDAEKAIKKLQSRIITSANAEVIKSQIDKVYSGSIKAALIESYKLNDFFKGVERFDDNTFNFIEVDPPYGIGLVESKQGDVISSEYVEINHTEYDSFINKVCRSCYRVLRDNSWAIFWYAMPNQQLLWNALINAGFKFDKRPAIWNKEKTGQTNNPQLILGSTYELFIYARKGVPHIQKQGRSNVFTFHEVPPTKKIHPTEKSLELYKEIYATFCSEGSNVLVSFAGSGVSLIACYKHNCRGIGFDLSESFRNSFIVKVGELEKEVKHEGNS